MNVKSANNLFWLMIIIVLPLLLSACTEPVQEKPKAPVKTEKNRPPKSTVSEKEWKLPIAVAEGEFYKSAGWLADNDILYITNLEQTSSLYRYQLFTGKSELIYKSNAPIVNAQISSSKEYILIHSSPSSYEGIVTIIDTTGSVLASQSIASYELLFDWNPYNDSEVLISKFNEDWSFEVLLLDTQKATISKLSLPQPFVKWTGNHKYGFLNWDDNNPSLYAPLIEMEIGQDEGSTLFPAIIQFSPYQDILLTISANATENPQATYAFFDGEMKEVFSFTSPLLSRFSDWLIPFYDYYASGSQFAALKPKISGEADAYMDGFDLEFYNLKKHSSKVIMSGLENEPIQFSPSGDALLYGNRFEKIIDVSKRKILDLIKE
ncbi:hypothetical protein [Neobacillus niacini]|uniref:YqgU-like beta propeller domain-containing protein n=1 Tax=Neobacillus niacini TaxID=86668 RepID=UPI0021CAE3F5|nr:hypothetical protein [Neobacillus niacini]MCM3765274.1 hypothetical protein [Neobacillus niacini]